VDKERLRAPDKGLRLVVEGSDGGDGLVDPQEKIAVEGLLGTGG
jgi:hypothetical protein